MELNEIAFYEHHVVSSKENINFQKPLKSN